MAATAGAVAANASLAAAPAVLSSKRSEISGGVGSLWKPAAILPSSPARGVLRVEAIAKKVNVKEPFGAGGGVKFRDGVDASGRKATGKGVYQFAKKYGANVDGYSPIYSKNEWSSSGDIYSGGKTGLVLWAVTFGALLLVGGFLVYSTSSLA